MSTESVKVVPKNSMEERRIMPMADDVLAAVTAKVVDRHSVDCWFKEKRHSDGRVEEKFVLTLGDPHEPKQGEGVECCLYHAATAQCVPSIVYVSELELTDSELSKIMQSNVALCVVHPIERDLELTLSLLETTDVLQRTYESLVRVAAYLRLRTDIVDDTNMLMWGRGVGSVFAFSAYLLDNRWQDLVLESMPNQVRQRCKSLELRGDSRVNRIVEVEGNAWDGVIAIRYGAGS
jgi:hypothetical protein